MIEGIDVYHDDGAIDWNAVRADGISFAIAKASEGTTYRDSTFAGNWSGCKDAGIPIRGAYHFYSPTSAATTQAATFASMVEDAGLEPGDFLVFDMEKAGSKTGAQLHDDARAWIEDIRGRFPDQRVIIYTGNFWRETVKSPDSLGCELWLAAYVRPDGDWAPSRYIPIAWTQALLWQYTDKAPVSGIGRPVDGNRCRLSEEDLASWLRFELDDPFAGLPLPEPTLKRGARGAAVAELQRALGFDPADVDGIFGGQTEEAVRAFQSANGLDADGIVGHDTWSAIRAGQPTAA